MLTLAPGDLGGSETYARGLIRALAATGTLEYLTFVPAHAADSAGGLTTVVVRELQVARRGPSRIPAMWVTAARSRDLRHALETVDVVHYPLTVPIPRTGGPSVVSLQDLQHRDLPELFSRARRSFRHVAYDRVTRRATAVIVSSEFVRRRAIELLGLTDGRIHVIPLGVDHALFRPSEQPREPFLLYPARPWPHKNHARLFQAFALLRAELPELRLVLTGGGLEQLEPVPAGVERRGLVSSEELASLYRSAACLIFPSLYEGFGLPPLEAMASGCPVAAASAGAIPEVCGDVPVFFDPTDVDAIAAAILDANAHETELGERGIAHAAAYTWAETARHHDTIYVDALRRAA